MTWLLVEDDPDIRNVVAVMMQLWGEKPLTLSDGNAAWTWLDGVVSGTYKGELPELALMDIRMPGHTGDQIAARIRLTDRLKHIPIILMTAFSLTEAEVQNMVDNAGIDHLVKKPLPDMDDFRTTLYRVRDERWKRAAIPAASSVSLPTVTPRPVITPPAASPASPSKPVVAGPAPVTPTNQAKPTKVPGAPAKLNTTPEPPKSPTSTVPLPPASSKPAQPPATSKASKSPNSKA